MQNKIFTTEIGGKTLSAEFTDLAAQANGSVIVRYGETAVLATAVMGSVPKQLDYFPLTVDYEERFYASGTIPGGKYVRREGRPSEEATLSGRAVDRTVRPLFDSRMRVEVQVVVTILSFGDDDPDILAVLAASLALGVSDIPWNGPVGAVRLGHTNEGGWVVNPTYTNRAEAAHDLDALVCGQNGTINMIEVGAKNIPEDAIVLGLEEAQKAIAQIESFQKDIIKEIGKEKRAFEFPELSADAKNLFAEEIEPKLEANVFTGSRGGKDLHNLHDAWMTLMAEKLPDESAALAELFFEDKVEETFDRGVLAGKRPDGRATDEVRPLFAQAGGIAPMLHGTGVFYRGETHVLSALTLGGPEDSLLIEGMEGEAKKRFMHHYNFPPFSTGETGRMGGTNRRMIGHGALAEKALLPIIPPKETFPYTVRIVSEVLSSNGSSSMASVCGSTLALMDAGVPILSPVAGIAMGVVIESTKSEARNPKYTILTDIQGPEDHYGDMDFKVAGTKDGVTAIQMDVKVGGVPLSILKEGLVQAKVARLHILDTILKAIPEPRAELPARAPKILTTKIKKEFIGLVIGSGGKTINQIRDLTGAELTIEEDGTVFITGKNGGAEEAKRIVEELSREYVAGERLTGIVTRVTDFGAFVKLNAGSKLSGVKDTEGLVHVSEIAPFRINNVSDALKEGEEVPVVIKEIGMEGKIRLSIKDADPEFASRKGVVPSTGPAPERPPRFGRRDDRGGFSRGPHHRS